MKTLKMCVWVNPLGTDRGQYLRPVNVTYELEKPLKGKLYKVLKVADYYTDDEYKLHGITGVLALNSEMDELIASNDPEQVKMAKLELGIDLSKFKKKIMKKTTQPEPEDTTADLPW